MPVLPRSVSSRPVSSRSAKDRQFLNRAKPPHIFTLVVLAGLSALSINVFLPSLTGMAQYFGVSYATMQMAVSLYLLLSAVMQLLIGPLSDRYGRRPVLLVTLALFVLATIGCLLAPNAQIFLMCRLLQAVIASAMTLSRAVVRDMVPGPAAAAMIAYVTMGMSLVPMIGPVLGGLLDGLFGWQASFLLLLGLGIGCLWLTWADLGETNPPRAGLSIGGQFAQYPTLLREPRFWGYSLATAATGGTFYAFIGGVPFVGTNIFRISSTGTGILFALAGAGYMLGNFLSGRMSMRIGMDRMALWGSYLTLVCLAALGGLTWVGLSGVWPFAFATLILGIGNGLVMPNCNTGIVSVRPDLAGSASGLGGALTIGAGAGFASLAAYLLNHGTTEMPLVLLMGATALIAVLSIHWLMRHQP